MGDKNERELDEPVERKKRKESSAWAWALVITHCCIFFATCTLLLARYTPVCSKLIGKITNFFLVVLLNIFVNS
jgi:hypothetical protein